MAETINLSKVKREKLLSKLELLKQQIDDEDMIATLNEVETELTKKKYGLVWEEHSEEVDEQMKFNIPIFVEDKDKEIVSDASLPFNFLLEGDNLHSLKLLEKTHKGKIDVIYIDPPYNTGNKDFMYNDSYVDSDNEYRHSKWLSFMEKRLLIAKKILKEDGYIFISINYKEQAQLKLLCDDIFGENNLIGEITWESTTQPINSGISRFGLQQKTEWILVYSKNKQHKAIFLLKQSEGGLKYPHVGKLGKCRFEIIEKSDAGDYKRDTMKYEILGHFPRKGKRWQIGKTKAAELIARDRIEIVDGIVKKAVYPEDEVEKIKYLPFWSHFSAKEVGTAQNGKDELNTILNRAVGFDTVKPVKLIKEILYHFNNNVVILDFFAGSGTTAQAVLELNKDDDGNRKFILCTNNENNICEEITFQRCKTIILGTRKDGTSYSDGISANLKYYKTNFLPKNNDGTVTSKLLDSISELIKLEHHCEIDNHKIRIAFDDDEMDNIIKEDLTDCKKLFVSNEVFLTSEQEKMLENYGLEIIDIPEYYFAEELREVDEI